MGVAQHVGRVEHMAVVRHTCLGCDITYHAFEGRGNPGCPLCEARALVQTLQRQVQQLANANKMLQRDNEQMSLQMSLVQAMRSASDLLSDEDIMFVKSVLYRWRADNGCLALQPLAERQDAVLVVVGFKVVPRQGPRETHRCNSVGGRTLASCYADAFKMRGSVKALEMLARALANTLSHEA